MPKSDIGHALRTATDALKRRSTTPALDAEVLLAYVLKKDKTFLLSHSEAKLTAVQQKKFQTLINRRAELEPIAYLTGHKGFYGLDFFVDKRVLVPRPETELLIDAITTLVGKNTISIADIGTGSGCIAITLKKLLPQTAVYATDISTMALKVAKKNARRNHVTVKFLHGGLLAPLSKTKLDIVVANLPYGTPKMFDRKQLRHEPILALYAKQGGLELIEKLLRQILSRTDVRYVLLELDPRQKQKLQALIKRLLPKSKTTFLRDYAKRWRMVVIKI
jgi:release factor glutamine methyltransferase